MRVCLDTRADAGSVMAMKFACVGWGSLCWDPRELPVGDWRKDGPVLPLEFARRSQDGRITLVITEDGTELQTLWAELSAGSLDEAANLLRNREDCNVRHIGRTGAAFPFVERIEAWAKDRGPSSCTLSGDGCATSATCGKRRCR